MNTAAPEGTPRGKTMTQVLTAFFIPPCLGEALGRGILFEIAWFDDFHGSGENTRSCTFQQSEKSELNFLSAVTPEQFPRHGRNFGRAGCNRYTQFFEPCNLGAGITFTTLDDSPGMTHAFIRRS
jgi:hypothetical protein